MTYEVILSVRMVINKYRHELSEIIWDLICDIMSAIVDNIEEYGAYCEISAHRSPIVNFV